MNKITMNALHTCVFKAVTVLSDNKLKIKQQYCSKEPCLLVFSVMLKCFKILILTAEQSQSLHFSGPTWQNGVTFRHFNS